MRMILGSLPTRFADRASVSSAASPVLAAMLSAVLSACPVAMATAAAPPGPAVDKGPAPAAPPKFALEPVAVIEVAGRPADKDVVFNHVAFSPDGRLLAATSWHDPHVRVWDVVSQKPLTDFTLPDAKGAGPIAWSADGKRIATTDERGGAVVVIDLAGGQAVATFPNTGIKTYALSFSPDGARLATVADRNHVRLLDIGRQTQLRIDNFLGSSGAGAMIAHDADGRIVVVCQDDVHPRVLEPLTLKHAKGWDPRALSDNKDFAHPRSVWRAAMSADGRTVASANNDEFRLFDLAGVRSTAFAFGRVKLAQMALSADGRMLVVMSKGEADVTAFDTATGRPCGTFTKAGENWQSLSVAPAGGGLIAFGAAGPKVMLWRLAGK